MLYLSLSLSISVPLWDVGTCFPSTHLFFAGLGPKPALPSAGQHSGTLVPCRLLGRGREMLSISFDAHGLSLALSVSLFLHCLELLIKRSLKEYEHTVSQEFPICRCYWTRQAQKRLALLFPSGLVGEAWGCWSDIKITSVDLSFRVESVLPSAPTECCVVRENRILMWSNTYQRTPGGSSST